ncbi:MAG: twin-arginine translocase subunit TatB [Gammaproteobacteria bacterium]|jgi:sec-independent protein translocase protein TatB|nr:twin-arginine translocase subunit TatB [Gammaproteobacteria bacterium]MBT3722256.1 twin-arginine translocase subunit TatB [Gammaproteobacteria bacterium]MBT4078658.1 twin-arginine translocase subunit TatB [Gammaproteobacteria bacterium]MBT4193648.1 twin-arginine translocase subunit TatB [Gammaproteobacteria bacterium]MBT4450618.1 twin-arginine translocase subunit TatB [Gammaproteobacteria bacterium]
MFDMGFAEMMIIGIVALLVIGPERLPSVARKAGAYVAKVKRFITNVKSDVEREFRTDELQQMLKQQQEELSSLKDIVNETKKDVDLGSIEKSLRDSGEEVMSDYNSMSDSDTSKNDEPQAEKISS